MVYPLNHNTCVCPFVRKWSYPLQDNGDLHDGGIGKVEQEILLDFSLTVKAATLIFIPGCGLAVSSAKEGKIGSIYNLVKS